MSGTVAAFEAVIVALRAQRAAELDSYLRWQGEPPSPETAGLADYFLGQWKGLGMALDALHEAQALAVLEESVTPRVVL